LAQAAINCITRNQKEPSRNIGNLSSGTRWYFYGDGLFKIKPIFEFF